MNRWLIASLLFSISLFLVLICPPSSTPGPVVFGFLVALTGAGVAGQIIFFTKETDWED